MSDSYLFEKLPHFQIDLSLPPHLRWQPILKVYAQKIRLAYHTILQTMIPPTVQKLALPLVYYTIEKMAKKGRVLYAEELHAISKATNVPFGGICLMQIAYELCAACTSAIHNGQHYRTMDWPMQSLYDLSISVEFMYGGKPVYRGITWAGMIGILTAVKRGVGSVSLNYRRQDKSLLTNVVRLWKGYWPAGYLIRDVMEQTTSYDQLRDRLLTTQLVAPCYFIACAPEKSRVPSCIIVRDRQSLVECREHKDILVQTNCDDAKICRYRSEQDIFASVDRDTKARQCLQKESSLRSFLVEPILNSITVYACQMNPTTGQLTSIRIRRKGG